MSSLKVVVTGAKGQLGMDLMHILQKQGKYEVYGFGKQDLDITNVDQVKKTMEQVNPDIIIHAAAYTNVDLAEKEPQLAFQINGIGTQNIAVAASNQKAKLIYISTDYVFNGNNLRPYTELDTPDPIGVYGETKLAGEEFVRAYHNRFFIIRTSWIYGEYGNNFVKNMLKLAHEKKKISVVNDQVGCPTYTLDLVNSILAIMETDKYGVYHISNSGSCSWYEFAQAIFEEARLAVDLTPCQTIDFPRLAHRPKYSVLEHTSIKTNGFSNMRHWREALNIFMQSNKYEDSKIEKSHS
ncbi:dTDP-4-dehydrorhamnose reductase [Peribacillus asahii]|uniref:dTDP-4-dehydrorhamnose reductase n=1 Tax=Peribacillus asahii TaxID=228899 RepID=UPI0020797775|nr:dTDP-4-dehydrorhamnose reductase [Peribacillus asahii]USK68328.1 dTDP-4-dehydrorhamnose reductase [Peribacillus asahii]